MQRQTGRQRQRARQPSAGTEADAIQDGLRRIRAALGQLEQRQTLTGATREQIEQLMGTLEAQLASATTQMSLPMIEPRADRTVQAVIDQLSSLVASLAELEEPPAPATPPAEVNDLEVIDVPVNPTASAAMRAIYAGRRLTGWREDGQGEAQYLHRSRQGQITLRVGPSADEADSGAPVWTIIGDLTAETADVFLVILSRLAELPDPTKDAARIRLEEIAAARGVRLRRGRTDELYEAFMQHVQALRRLRVTMTWSDPRGRGKVSFGRPDAPELLLDIMNIEVEASGHVWHAFSCRAGQPLAYFMRPDDVRWLGRYATALLRLNPYTEEGVKKVGTFWCLLGAISSTHQRPPRATPATILEFIGEEPDRRNPGRTIRRLQEIHDRLAEIEVIRAAPALEPVSRLPGFFDDWLVRPIEVELAQPLVDAGVPAGHLPAPALPAPATTRPGLTTIPTVADMQSTPALLRHFRSEYGLTLMQLAEELDINFGTLSRYERGLRPIPATVAAAVVALWARHSARR